MAKMAVNNMETFTANIVREHLLEIVQDNQKVFYSKFQKFVKAIPDAQLTVLLDINDTYEKLMREFVDKINEGEIKA